MSLAALVISERTVGNHNNSIRDIRPLANRIQATHHPLPQRLIKPDQE